MAVDHIQLYADQRNACRRLFGQTSVHLPGRTDINHPRLSGGYAQRLYYYWRNEANALKSKITLGPTTLGIPDTAHKDAWLRAKIRFDFSGDTISRMASGNNILPENETVAFWLMLDQLVIPLRALGTTPTRFDLGIEAVSDVLDDIGKTASWIMPALLIGGGLLLYNTLAPRR